MLCGEVIWCASFDKKILVEGGIRTFFLAFIGLSEVFLEFLLEPTDEKPDVCLV